MLNLQVMLHKMTERINILEAAERANKEIIQSQAEQIAEHRAETTASAANAEKRMNAAAEKANSMNETLTEHGDLIGENKKEVSILKTRCDRQDLTGSEARLCPRAQQQRGPLSFF